MKSIDDDALCWPPCVISIGNLYNTDWDSNNIDQLSEVIANIMANHGLAVKSDGPYGLCTRHLNTKLFYTKQFVDSNDIIIRF